VDFPVPATVTEYTRSAPTFGAELYDANKTVIIKKGYYHESPAKLTTETHEQLIALKSILLRTMKTLVKNTQLKLQTFLVLI